VLTAATSLGGACSGCPSAVGSAAACAATCPACAAALDSYIIACAPPGLTFSASYDAITAFALATAASQPGEFKDCYDYILAARRPYAGASCSSAFDHVAGYMQTADHPSAAVDPSTGLLVANYSCLDATASFCPFECQNSLNLLAGACHSGDFVAWDGMGLAPSFLGMNGAPYGTQLSPEDAFAAFVSGEAAVPMNQASGVAAGVLYPLDLRACANASGVFPAYAPPPPQNPPAPAPPGPPAPPASTLGCLDALAAMSAAVDSTGECVTCESFSGTPQACAWACPRCAAALSSYLSACAGRLGEPSYDTLEGWAASSSFAAGADCHDYIVAAARPYSAASCGATFNLVVTHSQSADNPVAVVDDLTGTLTAPYPCLRGSADMCDPDCQADLNLLVAACAQGESVSWAGLGVPTDLLGGAPAAMSISLADAWGLFANGTAAQPANLRHGLWADPGPRPLQLMACANASLDAFPVATRRVRSSTAAEVAVKAAVLSVLVGLQSSRAAPATGSSAALSAVMDAAVSNMNTLVDVLEQFMSLHPAESGDALPSTFIQPEIVTSVLSTLSDVLLIPQLDGAGSAVAAASAKALQPLVARAMAALVAAASVNASASLCSSGSPPLVCSATPLFLSASCVDLSLPATASPLFSSGITFPGAPVRLYPLPLSTFLAGPGSTFGSSGGAAYTNASGPSITSLSYFLPFDPHADANTGSDAAVLNSNPATLLSLRFQDSVTGDPIVLANLVKPLTVDIQTPAVPAPTPARAAYTLVNTTAMVGELLAAYASNVPQLLDALNSSVASALLVAPSVNVSAPLQSFSLELVGARFTAVYTVDDFLLLPPSGAQLRAVATGLSNALGVDASGVNVSYAPGAYASAALVAFATDLANAGELVTIAAALTAETTTGAIHSALSSVGNSGAFLVTCDPGQAHMQLSLLASGEVSANLSAALGRQAMDAVLLGLDVLVAEFTNLPVPIGVEPALVFYDVLAGYPTVSATTSVLIVDASTVSSDTVAALLTSLSQTVGATLSASIGTPSVVLSGASVTMTVGLPGVVGSAAQLQAWAHAMLLAFQASLASSANVTTSSFEISTSPTLKVALTVKAVTNNASTAASLAHTSASDAAWLSVQSALGTVAAGVAAVLMGPPSLTLLVNVSSELPPSSEFYSAWLSDLVQAAAVRTTGALSVLGTSAATLGATSGGVANCTVQLSFDNLGAASLSSLALTAIAASITDELSARSRPPGAAFWPPTVALAGGNVTLQVQLEGFYGTTIHASWARAMQSALAAAGGVPAATTWLTTIPGDPLTSTAINVVLGVAVANSSLVTVSNALADVTTLSALQTAVSTAARGSLIMLTPVEAASLSVTYNITTLTTDSSAAFTTALQAAINSSAPSVLGVATATFEPVVADVGAASTNFSMIATFSNLHASALNFAAVNDMVSNFNDMVTDGSSQTLSVSLAGGNVKLPLQFDVIYDSTIPLAWTDAMQRALADAVGAQGATTSAETRPGNAASGTPTAVNLAIGTSTADAGALAALANAASSPAALLAIQKAVNATAGYAVQLSLLRSPSASVKAAVIGTSISTASPQFDGPAGASALSSAFVGEITAALTSIPGMVSFQFTPAESQSIAAAAESPPLTVVVRFWNETSASYSTVGISTMPNPQPPNATFVWRTDFSAKSDNDMPLAWAMVYANCNELLINCSDADERNLQISLNPQSSIGDPVVTCSVNQTGLMRVFVNDRCDLWQPGGGSVQCQWNLATQAFAGTGCLFVDFTKFATIHTTDFMVTSTPQIAVASPSDLASVDPRMLLNLKGLIIALAALFAAMICTAVVLSRRDVRDTLFQQRVAHSTIMGCFEATACNGERLHVWRFTQSTRDGCIEGPAVAFAALVGVPLARLRFAIPGSLFTGDADTELAASLGCDVGFLSSVLELESGTAKPRKSEIVAVDISGRDADDSRSRRDVVGFHLAGAPDAACKPSLPMASQPDMLQLSSTALMYALLQTRCLLSQSEVTAACALYASLLQHASPEWPALFLRLFEVYKELLQGSLFGKTGWILKAEAFRLILLAQLEPVLVQPPPQVLPDRFAAGDETARFVDTAGSPTLDRDNGAAALQLPQAGLAPLNNTAGVSGDAPAPVAVTLSKEVGTASLLASPRGGSPAGVFWEPGVELAVALRARSTDVEPVTPRGLRIIFAYVQRLALAASSYFIDSSGVDLAKTAGDIAAANAVVRSGTTDVNNAPTAVASVQQQSDLVTSRKQVLKQMASTGSEAKEAHPAEVKPAHPVVDPLLFSADAIQESTPPALLHRFGQEELAVAYRCWATLLAGAYLDSSEFSWLVEGSTAEAPDAPARTIVDASVAWLAATLDDASLVAELQRCAVERLDHWKRTHESVCTASRERIVGSFVNARREAVRNVARAVNESLHLGSLSLVTSTVLGSKRWMHVIVLASTLLACLLVQLWLFWSKAKICCAQTRTALGCSPDPLMPCRGYSGNCALLSSVNFHFAAAALRPPTGLQPLVADSRPLPPPACDAFPNDSARDTFLSGLISAAVAYPFASIVSVLFSLSLATDASQSRGRMRLLKWPFLLRLCGISNSGWQFDHMSPRRRTASTFIGQNWSTTLIQDIVVASDRALRRALSRLTHVPAFSCMASLEPGPAPGLAVGDAAVVAAAFDTWTGRCKQVALVLTCMLWAVFVWLSITYASLIYRMLDPDTEDQLVKTWLVSIGLNQASDLQNAAITLVEVLLLSNILEALWLVPNSRWFEERFDFLSVQAAAAGSVWAVLERPAASQPACGVRLCHRLVAVLRRAYHRDAAAVVARISAGVRAHTRHHAALS